MADSTSTLPNTNGTPIRRDDKLAGATKGNGSR